MHEKKKHDKLLKKEAEKAEEEAKKKVTLTAKLEATEIPKNQAAVNAAQNGKINHLVDQMSLVLDKL